jgi:hypothetical protein
MEPKQEKMMIEMWLDGKTGLQIAEELNTTRNAIMGRLKRLRDRGLIEYRIVPPSKPVTTNIVYLPIKNRRILREIKAGIREAPKIFVTPEKKNVLKPPVRFFSLTVMSCKFPINDGAPQDFLFCGDHRHPGSSYCERHHKICYIAGTSDNGRNQKRKRKTFKYDRSTQPTYPNQDT